MSRGQWQVVQMRDRDGSWTQRPTGKYPTAALAFDVAQSALNHAAACLEAPQDSSAHAEVIITVAVTNRLSWMRRKYSMTYCPLSGTWTTRLL